ncbi:serine hydrolase domain-containing protein [Streptomyces sp. NPDC057557]|uniref:serine hydrolase domain-containing protein n=1 Tax=Streptomyces sp. NPDC057557 TaxID=3346167 RepID=UPI00368D2C68
MNSMSHPAAPSPLKAVESAERALREAPFAAGLSMAVTNRTGVMSSSVHGLADVAAGRPVTADTLFEIGSVSKGFTCALLLQAQDAGLIDLDQPVARYLPWFRVRSRFAPVTVRHLMTHTAGIIEGSDFSGEAAFEVWSLRETEATSPPGTWFHYSNVGYKALGLVLEAVHEQPYHQILRERLLAPLGMTSAVPAITDGVRPRLAVGYEPRSGGSAQIATDGLIPATWLETATADGSIAATALDMTAWLRLLLGTGTGRLLSDHGRDEMFLPAIAIDDDHSGSSYGLGIRTGEIDGRHHVWHSGGMIGYYSAVACDLDSGIGAVVLANGPGPWQEAALHALAAARAEAAGAPVPEFTVLPHDEEPLRADPPPPAWAPFVGHYRCHNPWLPGLRVIARDGRLWAWLGDGDEQVLTQLPDGSFRIGADERSPERLRFDTVIGGTATRATHSGCALYRSFTP